MASDKWIVQSTLASNEDQMRRSPANNAKEHLSSVSWMHRNLLLQLAVKSLILFVLLLGKRGADLTEEDTRLHTRSFALQLMMILKKPTLLSKAGEEDE